MIKDKQALVYAEVDEILGMLEEKYYLMIPEKIRNKIKDEKNTNYKNKFKNLNEINDENLLRESRALIAYLYYNYWCNNDEEKQQLIALFLKNESLHQNELREKYNPNNIFRKNK